jgi:hypothetical protein
MGLAPADIPADLDCQCPYPPGTFSVFLVREINKLKAVIETKIHACRGPSAEIALQNTEVFEKLNGAEGTGSDATVTPRTLLFIHGDKGITLGGFISPDGIGRAYRHAHCILALQTDGRPGPSLQSPGNDSYARVQGIKGSLPGTRAGQLAHAATGTVFCLNEQNSIAHLLLPYPPGTMVVMRTSSPSPSAVRSPSGSESTFRPLTRIANLSLS